MNAYCGALEPEHGGPDLGPTRARRAWADLGVDGLGIAYNAPGPAHPIGQPPRLTVPMVARLQGFPDFWEFGGRKTAAYRQVGNAFPPQSLGHWAPRSPTRSTRFPHLRPHRNDPELL